MIIGHTSIPILLSNFIYAFHMPLFFIASGWTTNWDKYSISAFITRRFKTLMIPFFIYSTTVQILMYIINKGDLENWFLHGWGGYALWFIPVLYLSSILVKVLYSITPRFILLWGAIMAIFGGFLKYNSIILPWTLSSIPYASFLIIIGSILNRYYDYLEKTRWWLIILTFLVTVFISYNWRLDIAWNCILPIVPLSIGAILGTMMMFMVSTYIMQKSEFLTRLFVSIGKETYVVVSFSQIIIMTLNYYTTWNSIIRYTILIIVLVFLKIIKDMFNKTIGYKIL